ncbi:separin [Mixophyes fleayi]|uniref:separin n=1 Tax=Mixophyes fleayi TaxID=3061075 RepID=UPI003F4D9910
MKAFKTADFIKLTSSLEMVVKLQTDLKSCMSDVPCDPSHLDQLLDQRVVCDRVLRACNHWAAVASCHGQHLHSLVNLAELVSQGFYVSSSQHTPFYLEKILFHLLKNVSAQESSNQACTQLSDLLYSYLSKCPSEQQNGGDFSAVSKSSFQCLWKAAGEQEQKQSPCPHNRQTLFLRLHALRFLMLVECSSSDVDSTITISRHAKYATLAFDAKGKPCSQSDACFLSQSVEDLLIKPLKECGKWTHSWALCLVELTIERIRMLCKSNCFHQSREVIQQAFACLKQSGRCCQSGLMLLSSAIEIHESKSHEIGKRLVEMAETIGDVCSSGDGWLCQALCECCQFTVYCLDGRFKLAANSGTQETSEVLGLAKFLEMHFNLLEKQVSVLSNDGTRQLRALKQQQFCGLQQFSNAACSVLQTCKDMMFEDLQLLLGACKDTVSRMLTSIQGVSGQDAAEFLNITASCVHNLSYWFYNQKKYKEAVDLVSPLCEWLAMAGPGSELAVERLHRCFKLHVESCRKAGYTALGLAAVTLWLRALRTEVSSQMAEPVALWVRLKVDGVKNGDEDVRLHTLKDGLADHPMDPELMVSLLAEELKGYKSVHGDTGQERYNTICDLLELCAEDSSLHHHRAPFLLELAQVLCYHDYSGQTECTALDAVQDCLRLLESATQVSENQARLLDIKAQALLWQYICTLEANMREVLAEQQRKEKLESQRQFTGVEYEPNDLNYEDKLHDDQSARDGICFTLAGEEGPMKGLDEALDLWKCLSGFQNPSLSSSEQTVFSLHLLGSLFRLMGKPLQAIQSFTLVRHLCRSLGDHIREAGALCHLTKLLFYLESPEYAQVTLQEAEAALQCADCASESYLLAERWCQLLRSHLCRVTNQVKKGVEILVSLLQHPSLQKSSKAWYLLKVHVLQELSMFLRLPPAILLPDVYKKLCAQGWRNPETALTEAHKLLRSIVLLLLGNDVLSTPKGTSEVRFVDNGENLLQKWQVLADLLSCSQDLVSTLSCLGSVSESKSFCLEGLRLAKSLHSMRHCADFLVRKAELETVRAEAQLCEEDLQYVVFLMESCTDFTAKSQQKEVKIKLSKGKQSKKKVKTPELTPPADDFLKGIQFQFVKTRDLIKHPESPTIPPSSQKTLPSFVSHTVECACPLCSDLVLSLLCTRWLAAQAENDPQSRKLLQSALKRCQSITYRFSEILNELLGTKNVNSGSLGIANELIARVYQAIVSLSPSPNLPEGTLEDGLRFVSSRPATFPKHWMASLLLAKALDSIYKLATKHGGCIADLFMQIWGWKPLQDGRTVSCLNSKSSMTSSNAPTNKRKGFQKLSVDVQDIFSPEESDSLLLPVPSKIVTPLRKDRLTIQAKSALSTVRKKGSVAVYEESPMPELEPRAPRRRKTRTVIKVEFSDSDLEMPDDTDTDPTWKGKKQTERANPGTRGRVKSCTLPAASESEEEEVNTKSRPRKGRGSTKKAPKESSSPGMQRRRPQGKLDLAPVEVLRSIEEEPEWVLDLSIDELRTSDTEEPKLLRGYKGQKPSKKEKVAECEILRRDVGGEQQSWIPGTKEREADTNIFSLTGLSSSLPAIFSASDLHSVSALLHEALESVAHFPPSVLYTRLCRLLALCSGGQDPYMTALLVSESVSITLRHQLLSDIHRKLRKLKKEGLGDVSDKLQCLTLDDHKDPRVQYLSQLEALFQFPKQSLATHAFKEQLQQIPANTTVCILTLADSQPRSPGDTLLLCRLEQGSTPVTVQIPTAHLKVPLSSTLQEFDEIQKQQKTVNNLTDKKEWWEGRTALDSRMKALIQSLEEQVLGCWKVLLLPPCSAGAVEEEARVISKALSVCGWRRPEAALLKMILGGCHHVTPEHIHSFTQGFGASKAEQAQELLQKAINRLKLKTQPTEGHLVLVLDMHLQKLPWESMPCLLTRSVTRLPSLHFLLNYGLLKKHQPQSTLVHGVDPKKTFYVLNPHSNLPGTEERFRDWFKNEPGWKGVIRSSPKSEEIQSALTKQDLYIYVGHGAGAHFLDVQTLQRLDCNAVALLFGCSSAALAVRGDLEGAGIVLKYLMAGCPLVVGNLWDVTDREIDRYTVAFLQGWLKAGPGASLLKYLSESRQAPKLKSIIGAAPVAYGLPVALR